MTGLPRSRRTTLAPLAVLALAAGLLAGCGSSDDDQRPAGSATKKTRGQHGGSGGSGSSGSSGSSGGATEGTGSSGGGGTGKVTVPVYFASETPQGTRLFREFRTVDAARPLDAAAALVTSGEALDQDYTTMYPGGAYAGVTHETGGFSVQLADDGWTTPASGMSADDADLAVQQLVYTIQGVEQSRDPVTFYLGGEPTTIFGIDSSGGIGNAPQLEVSSLVNVTQPEEGETVGSSFTAEGVASSFEATVPWEIRQGGAVVEKGFATADGWMDKLYPFRTEVDVSGLASGTYTFVAMTDDPSDGEGGGPTEDSKTIVVR